MLAGNISVVIEAAFQHNIVRLPFAKGGSVLMTKRRKVIVHIATSAAGYIARPDGDLEWLTSRPAPVGFYGMDAFMKSIDTKLIGRKTYEVSPHGGEVRSGSRTIVFSVMHHQPMHRQLWSS